VSDGRAGVVILTHNRRTDVTRSLKRMLALPERPRIVVVDNGSTDGTATALAERLPEVRVIVLPDNRGAAARNEGVRALDTPYVALCDDDTWWAPGAVARAADVLDAHSRLAVVTGRVLVGARAREDPACRQMAASPLGPLPAVPGVAVLGFLAGASMVRRAAFLEAGGFEPRFFLGGEEELLAVDLVGRGWLLAYDPRVVVHHHPSAQRDARRRKRLLTRNALWFAWLRRPLKSALRQTGRSLRAGLGDRLVLRGCLDAVAGARWIARHRSVVTADVESMLRALEQAASTAAAVRTAAGATRPGCPTSGSSAA
jgi:GT2 family glycosyltransferase